MAPVLKKKFAVTSICLMLCHPFSKKSNSLILSVLTFPVLNFPCLIALLTTEEQKSFPSARQE